MCVVRPSSLCQQMVSPKINARTNAIAREMTVNFSCDDGYEYLIQRSNKTIVLGGFRLRSRAPGQGLDTYDDERFEQQAEKDSQHFSSSLDKDIASSARDWLKTFMSMDEKDVVCDWSGIMAFTKDELPLSESIIDRQLLLLMPLVIVSVNFLWRRALFSVIFASRGMTRNRQTNSFWLDSTATAWRWRLDAPNNWWRTWWTKKKAKFQPKSIVNDM